MGSLRATHIIRRITVMRKSKHYLRVLAISLCLSATGAINVFADNPVVTADKTINNAYYFQTDKYSSEDDLMPFKLAKNFMFGGYGYADGNFNVVIPINEDWKNAYEFIEGIAVVEGSEQYIAIDRSGTKLFDMEEANNYTGLMSRFKGDSNGYIACTIRNNGSLEFLPGNPVMTTYDRAGNRTEYQLAYDKVGRFVNGYANVYRLDEKRYVNVSFTDDFSSPDVLYTYKVVGSINSTGEFFSKTNPEDKSNDKIEPYHLNNGYSLIQDKDGEWGNATYKLVDSSGTEYGRYLDVQGVINGNQFIGRPYRTKEEVAKYISQYGQNTNGLTDYIYMGAEYSYCDLTPRTIFTVNN